MHSFEIHIPRMEQSCPVHVGSKLLPRITSLLDISGVSKIAVVVDKNVAKLWLNSLMAGLGSTPSVIEMEPGEDSKSITHLEHIWNEMLGARLDRDSLVINLGGGMIGDLGGFAASTFMRGLRYVHIPTTLLAMADASIGGKVAINLEHHKNLAGMFSQPHAIFMDLDTLSTLPARELRSGFAEMIKHAIITDRELLQSIAGYSADLLRLDGIESVLLRSISIKKAIVERDPLDCGERQLLNFGHTIGHAVEALSQKCPSPLLHGEAVSIGIAIESLLAEMAGLISQEESRLIADTLKKFELPTSLPPEISPEGILSLITADKKMRNGRLMWTLPHRIGQMLFNVEVPDETVRSALVSAGGK